MKLTPRQWALHNYIASRKGERVSKRDIYENVSGYAWNENASDKCATIRLDQKAINASGECDSLIVFDHQEYYLATREQVEGFIERKMRTIRTAAREVSELRRKLGLDGQGKLLNNQLNPLREGNEEFHETVIHDDRADD